MATRPDPPPGNNPLMTLDEARAAILRDITPLPGVESLDPAAALGRVLAEPLVSGIDIPEFANSAMDGYAVRSADAVAGAGTALEVSQHIRAGDSTAPLRPGTAARIFTGAPLPAGADAVIMQEDCEREGDRVRLNAAVAAGQHVRPRAHDIARGATVLAAGHRMRPQDVAIAAAAGTMSLKVRPRPRVAVFSTGNELALPGQPLASGQRYTANNHLLAALSRGAGASVTDAGIVPDDLTVTCGQLEKLATGHDLLLSSGGASVGDEDHVHRALEKVGRVGLWRIALRPGKPVIFGSVKETSFVGLPGNPVSVFVTFLLLVRPLILALQGATVDLPVIQVRAGFDWPRAGSRREFVRARRYRDEDGATAVAIYPDQASDVLSSAIWADGLVDIPAGRTLVKGDRVGYVPFTGLLD